MFDDEPVAAAPAPQARQATSDRWLILGVVLFGLTCAFGFLTVHWYAIEKHRSETTYILYGPDIALYPLRGIFNLEAKFLGSRFSVDNDFGSLAGLYVPPPFGRDGYHLLFDNVTARAYLKIDWFGHRVPCFFPTPDGYPIIVYPGKDTAH